jgi:hypothetical protein
MRGHDDLPARVGARLKHHARALTVAALLVSLAGCATGPRSGQRDVGALEPERAALQANAQRACEGVPSEDIAPGLAGLDVRRIAVLERPIRYRGDVVEGAAAAIQIGERSFESMDRIMRCRASRAVVERAPTDPLAVPGASLRVYRDDGAAVIVQIRSRNEDAAREIVRRLSDRVPSDEDDAGTHRDASHFGGTHDAAPHGRPPSRSPGVVAPGASPARPVWLP